ncbi:MAG: hypothetical protein P4M04_06560 [Acidobacteriota bacterium]|nr:hypothetical protein [Acidobacteriota bacterium]
MLEQRAAGRADIGRVPSRQGISEFVTYVIESGEQRLYIGAFFITTPRFAVAWSGTEIVLRVEQRFSAALGKWLVVAALAAEGRNAYLRR